jgi:hypothetical protein
MDSLISPSGMQSMRCDARKAVVMHAVMEVDRVASTRLADSAFPGPECGDLHDQKIQTQNAAENEGE